jgi:hypothetical protein
VSITSFDENQVVARFRGATNDLRAWIGLTDTATEGTFLWVTGEPFQFSSWNGGEPNNGVGQPSTPPEGEDFVEIFAAGVWNDNRGDTPLNQGYVVEYPTDPTALVDSPPPPGLGTHGDFIDRGFYHPAYPAALLSTVRVWLSTPTADTYTITMTARAGTYDGPVLGTSTVTIGLPAGTGFSTPIDFVFTPAAVTPGSTVTFTMTQVSPAVLNVYYDIGTCTFGPCATPSPFKETEGTTPPLDTPRRNGVSAIIFDTRPLPVIIQ